MLYQAQLVAICEMKTSCFEIVEVVRQHEAKLAAVACSDGIWSVGQTPNLPLLPQPNSAAPGLYFATALPEKDEWMVGIKPLLSHAICEGIRAQG